MNAIIPNESCFTCGGTATSRDSDIHLYCHDCEAVSTTAGPATAAKGIPPMDPSSTGDRWAREGGGSVGDAA
jgi:hypothetical protein